MALDYISILSRVEAHFPQALGSSSSQDTVLKGSIVQFANDLIAEIDREQRWSLAFNEPSFTTVLGTQAYALPYPAAGGSGLISQTFIDRVWWKDDVTGRLVRMQRLDKQELQRVFGDPVGTTVNVGEPRYYTIEASPTYAAGSPTLRMLLFPTPDANGPTSGAYTIRMSGYFNTPPIIEVRGTSAVSTTLTWTSGTDAYLTGRGVPTSSSGLGLTLSIRGAGVPGPTGTFDTHLTGWTALAATTATLTTAAKAAVTNTQCFFNSTNWMITHWPKLLIFGILREVASYYGSTEKYTVWEQRYQDQLRRLRDYEFDRARSFNAHAIAYAGGDTSSLRWQDPSNLVDVRGGELV